MKPTKLFALLFAAAASACATGCSSSDFCSQAQSFGSKNAACASSISTPSQATCESSLAKCNASDQTKLNNYIQCASKQPACTAATASTWGLTFLSACSSEVAALQTLSSACSLGSGGSCTINLTTCAPGDPTCDTTCGPNGLACSNYTSGTTAAAVGTCQLPAEFGTCKPAIGCAQTPTAYDCVAGVFANPTCFEKCTSSANECGNPQDACQLITKTGTQKYCFYNICGPGSSPANGTAFYGPCTVVTANDGYCLPFQDTSGAAHGVCYPTGTQATNASCTTDRPAGGTASFCAAGNTCTTSLCATAPTDQGYCAPVCGAAPVSSTATDAGPACASTASCVGMAGFWGVCGSNCTPPSGSGTGCPGGSSCSAPNSNCYALNGADGGVIGGACLP